MIIPIIIPKIEKTYELVIIKQFLSKSTVVLFSESISSGELECSDSFVRQLKLWKFKNRLNIPLISNINEPII